MQLLSSINDIKERSAGQRVKEIQFCTNENEAAVRQLISKAGSQSGCLGLQAHGDPLKNEFWLH